MKIQFLFILMVLSTLTSLSAQTTAERAGERAKDRAERRANSNVDRKVDGAVDDAFNAVGNLFKKKKKKAKKGETPAGTGTAAGDNGSGGTTPAGNAEAGDAANMGALNGLMGGNSDPWVPYTNPISFSVRMEMTEVKKNGKTEDMAMTMSVVSDQFGIRIEDAENNEQTRMILNTQDGKTTMITTDKKGQTSGFRMKMPGARSAAESSVENVMDGITIEETNETRVIDGYNCRKYIVTDTKRETVTESWVTTEAGINSREIFAGMMSAFGGKAGKQKGGPGTALAGGYDGFPILSISNDGKSTYTMRFKDLKVGEANMDKSVLDTSGVQIQSLGF